MPARSGGSYVLRGDTAERVAFSGTASDVSPKTDTEDAPETAVDTQPSQEPDANEDA